MMEISTEHDDRLHVGRLSVDRVDQRGALDAIARMIEMGVGGTVFTPNVDHVVLAEGNADFRRAYDDADLSLADGMPIVWVSHLFGDPLPEKVSGSDLVEPLMQRAASRGWRVYFLGGREGVARSAADALLRKYPRLNVVGMSSPMIDLSRPRSERANVIDDIRRAAPDLVLVGFGAPKQELWMHESLDDLRPAVLFGVGASLDFLAGTAKRAPKWMSRFGLEWLHRLVQEPGRMSRRYLLRDPKFLGIVAGDLLDRRFRVRSPEAPP